jgi:hypothetical protein
MLNLEAKSVKEHLTFSRQIHIQQRVEVQKGYGVGFVSLQNM